MGLEPIGFEASCAEQTLAKLSSNAEFIINFFSSFFILSTKEIILLAYMYEQCSAVHCAPVCRCWKYPSEKNQELIKSYKMLILLHFCI